MDSNLANSINQTEIATIGNGCFWCTEAIFQKLKGVLSAVSGYSGGHMENPDYKSVCSGTTGHAECLQIKFDPAVVSFSDLLKIFWETHDPTSLNRQGEDVGTQYRSVIFYHDELQKNIAEAYIKELNQSEVYQKPIVTTLEKFEKFYPAEDYHQGYYELNGTNPYCQFVVRPKVEKFKKAYSDKLKSTNS
jgi:methionine-S-sulfoxide reductase